MEESSSFKLRYYATILGLVVILAAMGFGALGSFLEYRSYRLDGRALKGLIDRKSPAGESGFHYYILVDIDGVKEEFKITSSQSLLIYDSVNLMYSPSTNYLALASESGSLRSTYLSGGMFFVLIIIFIVLIVNPGILYRFDGTLDNQG